MLTAASSWLGRLAVISALALVALANAAIADGPPVAESAAEVPAAAATTGAPADPPPRAKYREPERLTHKPSGFWTSNRPSTGGAYKYRLLGIGVGLVIVTGIGTIWVVRKHGRTAR